MFSAPLYLLSFLLVGILLVAAHVEPPTNVTLHCGNMKDIVEWEYTNLSWSQGLQFRVEILTNDASEGFPKEILVESLPLQADVSFLSHPDHEYFLTVTAKIGQEESQPSPEDGIVFSYFRSSLVPQKCFLDFPSVTVIAKPNKEMLITFEHPWEVYLKNKKQDEENGEALPPFEYNIDVFDQPESHTFVCEKKVCEETVVVDHAQEKYCVKVSGEVEKIEVKGKEYCVQHTPTTEASYVYVYISVGLLVVVVSALLGCMMYRKKTNPSSSLPNSMTFNRPLSSPFSPPENQITVEKGPILEVEPKSPTPLLTDILEENHSPIPSDYEGRMHLRLPTEDEGVSDVGEQNQCPDYMLGNNFEEDDTLVSNGYERRDVLVNIDPNDQTQGYRG